MSKTHLGVTALACAAAADVTAWCMLAVVMAIVKGGGMTTALLTIVLALVFTGAMLFLVRPQLCRLFGARVEAAARADGSAVGVLAFVLACAWATEMIGIHALFGAFLAGVVMPPAEGFRSALKEKLEPFSAAVLLPIFFACTGLRMQINLLGDWQGWLTCLGIIAVAVAGKLGGSMLAARWTGMSWQDSFSLGVLMNTRGLIELIVLNVGYDLGILPARIFSMMVLMALATTFMAGPLLSLVAARTRPKSLLGSGVRAVG